MINIDVTNEVALVGDLKDEFRLVDYASLIVVNSPLGHASEYRLGEEISLSLDFTRLTNAFDFRLNKCWATSPEDGDSEFECYIPFKFIFA